MQHLLEPWWDALGYDPASPSLHQPAGRQLIARHPYAPELHDLLNPQGEIRAQAVFDVEGVPTVGFFADDGSLLDDPARLTALRQRIWNQGLISIVLVATPTALVPVSVNPRAGVGQALSREQARRDGPLSRADVQSGDVRNRYPDWFQAEDRVDRKLLTNLRITIERLEKLRHTDTTTVTREDAQYLVGQVLFVSYLEHRGIVGDIYRDKRNVGTLKALVDQRDRDGVMRLLQQLKIDFNGDFLEREDGAGAVWRLLPNEAFGVIQDLLSATDLSRAQPSFFPYNFRYIPVELLSGIYESFIGESKKGLAAYYTPRNLANLVVDQAFEASSDILAERIFDGACGSGILLTTAFRRMLGEAEARSTQQQLSLTERIAFLRDHIFGSDVSDAACRVTAFSLYLSLLERLEPSDIAALCDDANVTLPTLRGHNLFSGPVAGDFFSAANPHFQRGGYTLCLSNPPWREPATGERTSADVWAENESEPVPRALRQMAADFAWRAEAALTPNGRLCLILPMSLLLKPTSQDYLAAWLERVRWQRVINFGDLKELLFDDGRFSCVVLLAQRRTKLATQRWRIPVDETFEYWVPKADVGLAFGRLTLHGVDRHDVQTQAIVDQNRELVTRMWGDDYDMALWATLRLRGTFGDMFRGKTKRWTRCKGFHRTDNAAPAALRTSTEPLWDLRFLTPAHLKDLPVVVASEGLPFPREQIPSTPRPFEDLLPVFDGPRILFPDGPAPDRSIRAAFVNGPASFMSSVGAIAGPPADEDLLRFTAMYLRSDLVRYFMVMQLYQLLSDRDRVSLRDIADFPFFPPERHRSPDEARAIVSEVAKLSRALEAAPELGRLSLWEQQRPRVQQLIEAYFELDDEARAIVHETVEVIVPSTRPYGLSRVFEIASQRVSVARAHTYARALRTELEVWRDTHDGRGEFEIETLLTDADRAGPFGVVRISLRSERVPAPVARRTDDAVYAVLHELNQRKLLPLSVRESVYFVPDTVIQAGDTLYLIKPQTERLWLRRQALRDAATIVKFTQRAALPQAAHG
ncbi:MAG: N-6 DNA methylase [Chiayiivirga sp.]|jgi:hypothetical protein|uniref:N-6 DNA methylase n=1 Tax=Chiayiivirga sp. TaxID=2041042 RepID=UPI0025C6F242|nr:N-6 DNA methylase [Chiayiivirga sp.]MCI1710973.1 N-6 DNA methylase [Chiayiivirga sp.]MCI1728214.1 N-6 DNA methylase [Chiayiivirga sp.]